MRKLWEQLAIATNWPVLVAVGVLASMGILSIWYHSEADGKKQLAFLVLAIGCMAAFQIVNYQKIGRYSWPFYIFSVLLILYTLLGQTISVPGVRNVKGAYNWINFGPVSLQPAELMKVSFVMVMARYLRFRSNYRTLKGLILPFALALGPVALILKQPDLGTALVFIPALFVMLFVAGAKIRHLLAIVALGIAMVPVLWLSGKHVIVKDNGTRETCTLCANLPLMRNLPQFVKHYQRERVLAMFASDPKTRQGIGYQQMYALIATGSGGLSGKGLGNIPVGRYVPEAHNDMIFALIGEQFGFFGAAIILAAYIVLFTAGIEIAGSTKEPFGRLVALGIVAMLAGQTFLNLMVAMRLMPVTGITLPFVSYGGSSLLASFMAAGLLLNIGQNRPLVIAREAFEY